MPYYRCYDQSIGDLLMSDLRNRLPVHFPLSVTLSEFDLETCTASMCSYRCVRTYFLAND